MINFISYQKETPSNMAVMEVYMPSGYQVDEEQAKQLVGSTPDLSRVDVEDEQTKVNLYFDKVRFIFHIETLR